MSVTSLLSTSPTTQGCFQAWFDSIRGVLEHISGTTFALVTPSVDESEAELRVLLETGLWTRFSAEKRLRGEQALLVSKADGLRLANILIGEPSSETAQFDETHADAVAELLRQAAGAAAVALGSRLGGEVGMVFGGTDRPGWAAAAHAAMRYTSPRVPPLCIHLLLSPELTAALESAPTEVEPSLLEPGLAKNPQRRSEVREANIDLLREVELEVTLRFGERQLLLRDILELAPGAVVELDQQVQDLVELLVGRKVIARGQIVVVDGNYGLKVTEIATQEERIASLRK